MKGTISLPRPDVPSQTMLQTLALYLAICCVTPRHGYRYQTSLLSFSMMRVYLCTLCNWLPALARSAMRACACHLPGPDMKPWTRPVCGGGRVSKQNPNHWPYFIEQQPVYNLVQQSTLREESVLDCRWTEKPVSAPAGREHEATR